MTQEERLKLLGVAGKLEALLQRETALRGEELQAAAEEKAKLVRELKEALRLEEEGAFERASVLQGRLKNLGIANAVALKMAKIRLTFSRLRKGPATGPATKRVDILT